MQACMREIARLLLERKEHRPRVDSWGGRALEAAARAGYHRVIGLLLEYAEDPLDLGLLDEALRLGRSYGHCAVVQIIERYIMVSCMMVVAHPLC